MEERNQFVKGDSAVDDGKLRFEFEEMNEYKLTNLHKHHCMILKFVRYLCGELY